MINWASHIPVHLSSLGFATAESEGLSDATFAWIAAFLSAALAALGAYFLTRLREQKIVATLKDWPLASREKGAPQGLTGPPPSMPGGALEEALAQVLERCSQAIQRSTEQAATFVTEESNRIEQLEHSLHDAEDSNVRKTRFLASMSHELRTPIGAILGYAEVIEEEKCDPDGFKQAVASIRRNGEHLLDLVNDILDLAKIEAGKLETESIDFTLEKVLKDVLSVMSVKAQAKGVRLEEVYLNPVPARVTSDPTRIRQVLINLVGNAVKFTERGSVTLGVSHQALENGLSRVDFKVQDTGVGIPQEKLEQLFKPFQQISIDTARKYGGTGLGLVISREIARLLGGDIEVRSDPGLGSLFTFSIRCKLVEGTPMLRRPSSAVLDDSRGGANRKSRLGSEKLTGKVLVVDDSPDNRKLFKYHLQAAGLTVELAENGREGAARGASEPFDVILMDIQMPELDGYGALKELRSSGVQTPVVALTAHAMKGDREKCLAAGFTDYLAKPVSRSDLVTKVEEYLRNKSGAAPVDAPNDELEEILRCFRETLPARARALDEARRRDDIETLRLLVHTLKGTVGSLGLVQLASVVAATHEALQSAERNQALISVERLCEACIVEAIEPATEPASST